MRWIKLIADFNHAFKANNLCNGLVHHPDHVDGAANTDNSCGGFYLKASLLELHQVFGKDLEFTHHYPEFSVSFLFPDVKFKFVQMKIRLFTHGHEAAVLERQPQPRICLGFELVMEIERHAQGYLDGFHHSFSGNSGRSFHPGDFSDHICPMGTQR